VYVAVFLSYQVAASIVSQQVVWPILKREFLSQMSYENYDQTKTEFNMMLWGGLVFSVVWVGSMLLFLMRANVRSYFALIAAGAATPYRALKRRPRPRG
jgi:hypothetical protein